MIPLPQGCSSWKALTSLCIVCASCCLKYPVMGPHYITHGRKMSLPPSLLSLCGELIYSSKRNRYWQDSHKARKDTERASKSIWTPPPPQNMFREDKPPNLMFHLEQQRHYFESSKILYEIVLIIDHVLLLSLYCDCPVVRFALLPSCFVIIWKWLTFLVMTYGQNDQSFV